MPGFSVKGMNSMFSLYFGHYLLNKGLITTGELTEALDLMDSVHFKLGVLAVNAGYMTAKQVDQVHQTQAGMDRMFGELAIELGYLTAGQLDDLLSTQSKGHLVIGQALVDKGRLSLEQLQAALEDYKKDYSLTDRQMYLQQEGDIDEIVSTYVKIEDSAENEIFRSYVSLMVRNVIRFIDSSPRVEARQVIENLDAQWLVWQEITGPINLFTAIACEENVFMELARRYSGQDLSGPPDELAQASVAEFLNLQNGLFLVHMSNNGVELEMKPQLVDHNRTMAKLGTSCIVPMFLNTGRCYLIVSNTAPVM